MTYHLFNPLYLSPLIKGGELGVRWYFPHIQSTASSASLYSLLPRMSIAGHPADRFEWSSRTAVYRRAVCGNPRPLPCYGQEIIMSPLPNRVERIIFCSQCRFLGHVPQVPRFKFPGQPAWVPAHRGHHPCRPAEISARWCLPVTFEGEGNMSVAATPAPPPGNVLSPLTGEGQHGS